MTWILTYTGRQFDLLQPTPDSIHPLDIAHALSHLCRFNGHVSKFYSVAEHSMRVAELVSRENQLAALLHDATEAYIGDITRPLKGVINTLADNLIINIERNIHHAIAERFGIDPEIPDEVHQADLIMLATERLALMPSHDEPWPCLQGIEPIEPSFETMRPAEARQDWVDMFELLGGKIKGG